MVLERAILKRSDAQGNEVDYPIAWETDISYRDMSSILKKCVDYTTMGIKKQIVIEPDKFMELLVQKAIREPEELVKNPESFLDLPQSLAMAIMEKVAGSYPLEDFLEKGLKILTGNRPSKKEELSIRPPTAS